MNFQQLVMLLQQHCSVAPVPLLSADSWHREWQPVSESFEQWQLYSRDCTTVVRTIKHGKITFRYEAPKLWNVLENKFKNVTDLDSFKESINLWAGPKCMCFYCSQCVLYKV